MVMDILSSMEDSDEVEEGDFFTKRFVSAGLKTLYYFNSAYSIFSNFVKS